jgi:signal transduction histidine kinase
MIVQTVREALKLPYAAVVLQQDHGDASVASSGVPIADPVRVPLLYQGERLGELLLGQRAPGEPFSRADRRLLDDLARQAGIAVHAVRLTADLQRSRERLVTAREEERRRLRRDLHDGLGAQLAALNLQAGVLRAAIPLDPAGADALAVELQAELRAAIANIRRLVNDLRPPARDELGLLATLRAHAAQYAATGVLATRADLVCEGQPVQVVVDGPDQLPPLPAAVEVAVYRIVQEALTNVVRHARARTCVVRLTVADEVRLSIADDGVGLARDGSVGMGLVSMRERAAELGGTCIVKAGTPGGTEVLVRVPLPKE